MAKIIRSRLKDFIHAKSRELGFEINQSQLARAVGIRQPTISAWMSDKPLARIDSAVLLALCNYLKCEPMELLIIEETSEDEEPGELMPA